MRFIVFIYKVWSKSIVTVAMVTKLKYAEWNCLAQIDLELSHACTLIAFLFTSLVYSSLEGNSVECGHLTTPQNFRQWPWQRKLRRESASNFTKSLVISAQGPMQNYRKCVCCVQVIPMLSRWPTKCQQWHTFWEMHKR